VLLTLRDVPGGRRLEPVYLEGAEALRPDLAARGSAAAEMRATPGGSSPAGDARAGAVRGRPRPDVRVALIGLGQIGGSIGLALGARGGWHRVGYDRDA